MIQLRIIIQINLAFFLLVTGINATYYRLTYGPGEKSHPSWSPDGTKIAYQSAQNFQWDIYTVPAQGGTPTRITTDAADDECPQWQPNHNKISFISNRQGVAIWTHDLATGQETMLIPNGDTHCWSPDGNKIAYSKYINGNTDIYVKDLTTGIETRLTFDTGQDGCPDWSHDGQNIIYEIGAIFSTIWIIPSQGGNPTQVPVDYGYGPKWHPNDNEIVFNAGTSTGSYGIWIYDLLKQKLTQISFTPQSIWCEDPAWSPDGNKITFASDMGDETSDGDIWVTDSYVYPTAFHIQFEIKSLGEIKAIFH